MKFQDFSKFLDQLENTAGRNQMTEDLAAFLPELDESEVRLAMYLLLGRLVPLYEDVEFNVSRKLVLRALQEMYPDKDVDALFKKLGDEGLTAEELSGKKSSVLSLKQAYDLLYSISQQDGKGSQEAKLDILKQVFSELDALSCRYATRVVIGNLRLGLSDKTILDSLSWAVAGDKSLRAAIERAYGAHSDLGHIAELVLEQKGADAVVARMAKITIQTGVPVASKLVEREKTAEATFERLGDCVAQPKLDGLRAQIHFDRKARIAKVFSRNMESLTDMFPDLLASVAKLSIDSIILDSEAIGYDHENDTYLPFQETMQRRRKHDVEEMAESIPVKAMTFDLLYLNGEDWSTRSLQERVAKLKEIVAKGDQKVIDMLESPMITSAEQLEEYFADKVGQGLEGIIVKKLDTTYDPGTRNFDWIKLKANTRSDLVDTVDTVVIGYYKGRGVRAKFGIGTLLVAVYDPEKEEFNSVAKVGTGFKDEDFVRIKKDLDKIELKQQPKNVNVEKPLLPDVWVKPEIVMEVDADEITRSPSHPAARTLKAKFEKDTKERGLSLRFPRMKVWKRDKRADQATTEAELLRMFELRKGL